MDAATDRRRYIDYDAAAELTGICRATLASMVSRHQIPHLRLGPRTVRFDAVELTAWLDARRVPARDLGAR